MRRWAFGVAIVAAAIACGEELAGPHDDGVDADASADASAGADASPDDAGCRIVWDASPRTFDDIPPDAAETIEIETLAEAGILDYCGAAKVCPDKATLRRETFRWAVRSSVSSLAEYEYACAAIFVDVVPEELDYGYMHKAKEMGITSGCHPTEVCPDLAITRLGVAIVSLEVARAQAYDASTPTRFADVPPSVSGVVERAAELELVTPCAASEADASAVADAGADASYYCPEKAAPRRFVAYALARARAMR